MNILTLSTKGQLTDENNVDCPLFIALSDPNIRSLSIIGMDKNTGKTETLNYVLKLLKNRKVGLTSIGTDGESVDLVTSSAKPEITVYEGTVFSTSEKHYTEKRLVAEILNVSKRSTSLGRIVTARALSDGKTLISGPPTTEWLRETIDEQLNYGAEIAIVDGALSRKSIASPTIADAMILATGAAVSANIQQLVNQTKFVCRLIDMPVYSNGGILKDIKRGVWSIGYDGNVNDLGIESVFMMDNNKSEILKHGNHIYVSGAVNDKLLDFLKSQKAVKKTVLIVRDFTKMFVSPIAYNSFIRNGGRIEVIERTKLLAITVNPFSPNGYALNSEAIIEALRKEINTEMILDVRKQ